MCLRSTDQRGTFFLKIPFLSFDVDIMFTVPSRRDDMEAVALMLIHLLTPSGLPWTRKGVPKTDPAHDQLKREKLTADPGDLCRGLPDEFEEFLRYCRRLKFTERPDYEGWVQRFRELLVGRGFPRSSAFVWPPPDPTVCLFFWFVLFPEGVMRVGY